MTIQNFRPNQWLISQGDVPTYFLHKLLKGRVGIYEDGERIASVEVKEGMKPKVLGFISALSGDHKHRASVKTETEVEVDSIYVEHIWGLLLHDLPEDMRKDIDDMIESIYLGDHIKGLRRKLSNRSVIDLEIRPDFDDELVEILQELRLLYENIMNDSECREQDV